MTQTAAETEAPVVVETVGLVRVYGEGDNAVQALRGVDLQVRRGEFVAVVGPSGSGKSTLLHLLGGLDRPDAGEVLLDGTSLASLPDKELGLIRRRQLGFVLQFFNLLPTLDAAENAAFPLSLDGVPDAIDRARTALGLVGLAGREDHRPSQLSGGEQQRVAIARALVTRPSLLLADEPTGNLDSRTGQEIVDLLRRTADEGQTIVMVTHDLRWTGVADRVVRIEDGQIATSDETASVAP
ncbi:MAG TPA: ABC transporter ATP-binding protein [Thermoleophilaceae bacterium]|jgi:putative ABC transport system ATP-binding protein